MRRLVLLAMLGLAACNSSPSVKGTCEQTVTIAGIAFNPGSVTIKKGGCVTFKNTDPFTHNIHVDTGSGIGKEMIGDLGGGSSGDTAALNEAVSYICGIHPSMKGKIEVQ